MDEQGWTADNPRIGGAMHEGHVGQLWYIGREESWYIVDAKSHQRLLHAAKLFVASDEGSNTAAGSAAARASCRLVPPCSLLLARHTRPRTVACACFALTSPALCVEKYRLG